MDSTNDKKEIRTIIIGDYTIQTYEIDYIKRIKNFEFLTELCLDITCKN